ncbi:2-octaprenyl-6-methoxyphenyl hydroxylase [Vibrio profundum]|uniref:2-octaprenyl-6-methoxyphenyl hydroxylase n=1 Tax=Vibrio profundum TaxID=2910247 RepID=UPI003D0EBB67
MKKYNVVIAGGAMAGMTLALALDELSGGALDIAVVEAYKADHSQHPGFDSRSIALSYGTVQLLQSYQLWSHIREHATAIRHIHVSDSHHFGMTEIVADDLSVDALGYVVELSHVGQVFAQQVQKRQRIDLFCPDKVKSICREAEKVDIELSSGDILSAQLLVAADGAHSHSCQMAGLTAQQHDFSQTAIIANVRSDLSHHGRAFERFTEFGPIALLPLSENRLSLVWCMPPEVAEHVAGCEDAEFLSRLQQGFGWRLGRFNQVGSRASYPLSLSYRPQTVSHRIAAVGNAAQTLHPIAGQGFNLGIRDVASLADEILMSLDDPGRYQTLANFRARRADDSRHTIALTTSLVRLFSNDIPLLSGARNVGLAAMDNFPALKSPLLNIALGLVAR